MPSLEASRRVTVSTVVLASVTIAFIAYYVYTVGWLSTGLYAVMFDPRLPAPFQDALRRIGFGRVAKAFFTFDDAYWRPRPAFWLAADPPNCFELWVDVSTLRGAPTLCAFAVGDQAEAVENLTEDELLELAWAELRSANGLIPHWSGS